MAAKRKKSRVTKAVRKPARKKKASSAAKPAKKAKKRAKAASKSRADSQVDQIQRVVDVMVAAGAVEVELEDAGSKLRIRLKEDQQVVAVAAAEPSAPVVARAATTVVDAPAAAEDPAPAAAAGETFNSPMVGTFYLASSPEAEPFVKVGDVVTEDSVLCIIEAMKVMNEIKAETEGQVVEIIAQNGEPVDYGQPLFVIRS